MAGTLRSRPPSASGPKGALWTAGTWGQARRLPPRRCRQEAAALLEPEELDEPDELLEPLVEDALDDELDDVPDDVPDVEGDEELVEGVVDDELLRESVR